MRRVLIALARFSPLILMALGFAAVFTFYRGVQRLSGEQDKYMAQISQQFLSVSRATTSAPYELIAVDVPEYEFVSSAPAETLTPLSSEEETALSGEEEFNTEDLPIFNFKLPPPPETFSVNKYPAILKKIDETSARVNAAKEMLGKADKITVSCSLDLCLVDTIRIDNDNAVLDCGGKTLMPLALDTVGVVIRASHVVVANCIFDRFRTALEIYGSDNIIFNNTMRRSEKDGVRVGGSGNVLFNNVVSGNNGKGIMISGTDTIFIGNTVGVNKESGIVLDASRGFIARSGIDGNAVGMAIVGGGGHIVFDSAFSGSVLGSGLAIASVSDSQFIGNTIKNNSLYGFAVSNAQSNIFAGNIVSGNTGGGVWFDSASSGNILRLNDIRENGGKCSLTISNLPAQAGENTFELNKLDTERCS